MDALDLWDLTVDDATLSQADNTDLWDTTIDDATLSQVGELVDDEIKCEGMLENMSLSQTMSMYDVDMADLNFDLTQVPVTVDNVLEELDKSLRNEGLHKSVRNEGSSRYGTFVDDEKISELISSTESKNTRKNTNWALTTFNDWRQARMKETGCTIPELTEQTPSELNKWMRNFVIETRRKDGKPYPPRSLYMLCVGLLRNMRENGIHHNFLDEKNSEFYEFRKALSARMAELTAHGIGTETRQAEPITQETENILWEKGLLGNGNAKSLLNFVFFYNCKLFALRAVDEHKNLSIQQLELGEDQNGYYIQFTGRANKTYKGKTFYLIKEIIRISDCIKYFIKMYVLMGIRISGKTIYMIWYGLSHRNKLNSVYY